MSLLQDALEKAKQPEKKPLTLRAAAAAKLETEEKVQPKPEIEHEPRLDSIKFYETLDKKVEADLDEIRPVRAKAPAAKIAEVPKVEIKKPEMKKAVARPVEEEQEEEKLPVYAHQEDMPKYQPVTQETVSWQTPVLIAFILLFSLLGIRYLVMHTPAQKKETKIVKTAPAAQASKPAAQAAVPAAAPSFRIQPPIPTSVVKTQVTSSNTKSFSQVRFLLTGITSYQDGRAFALINNQAVAVGDRLRENATVTSISGDTVILDLDGQEIRLTL